LRRKGMAGQMPNRKLLRLLFNRGEGLDHGNSEFRNLSGEFH
jgi:hypothetical protein